jgi:endonuclease YncB( thermonuclease family)
MYLNKTNLFLVTNICLIFFLLSFNDVKSEEVKIISGIAKVTDGDTIRIEGKKIRFFGIDAPEKKQQCKKPWLTISFISFNKNYPCGQISTDKLKKKINNKLLICKWSNKDRYKRYIAECFKDKTNINAWMVRNGYAVAYRKYSKKFVSQEIFAKKEKLGLWSGTFMMPWDYRKNN